jgi:squalene-associated FAD-dependent desaturase
MSSGTVYIVGAGLSGLSAAVALASQGSSVEVLEATPAAGGRCRSYFEPALGQIIDNGNHLILSGNEAVHTYLRTIGSSENFFGPRRAEFAFADMRTGERWTLRPNDGAFPWWTLSKRRRVPGTRFRDYAALRRLVNDGDVRAARGTVLWERLLQPVLLAALNTDPETATPSLIAAILRETLAKGGRACRPRIASPHLAAALVDPAIAYVQAKGGVFRFGQRLRNLVFEGAAVRGLDFGDTTRAVTDNDRVVLAVPPWIAKTLLPGLAAPDDFRAIVSGHFKIAPPEHAAPMTGLIGGAVEWVFAFPDRISVTISDADRFADRDREELAALCWREVAALFSLSAALPPWQIVKEKRATFAATPDQEKKRPGPETSWRNLFLAGDWTDTGLPATIEGAVRSGRRAAELALKHALV